MTAPTSDDSVLTSGAAAMTVVTSVSWPTSRLASTRARSFTWTMMPWRTYFLKPVQLDFDFVGARDEERGGVGAVGVGDDRGDGLFADFLDGDRGARHDLALRVGHRADDGSRRDLGGDRRRRADGCNEPRKQPNPSHVHS